MRSNTLRIGASAASCGSGVALIVACRRAVESIESDARWTPAQRRRYTTRRPAMLGLLTDDPRDGSAGSRTGEATDGDSPEIREAKARVADEERVRVGRRRAAGSLVDGFCVGNRQRS